MLSARRIPTVAALLCAACASSRNFAPRENQNGTGPTGAPAAVYPLPAPMRGDLRLWSDGARRSAPDGIPERTELLLGIEIENTGDAPIRVQPEDVVVRAVVGADAAFAARAAEAVAVDGAPQLAAIEATHGATARLGLMFVIDAAMPRDIQAFEVHWRVSSGDASGAQVTPFVVHVEDLRSLTWRDPWPWWGPGFGYWGYGYPYRWR